MEKYTCLLVEDDAIAIDMMKDYIDRTAELVLIGIAIELADVRSLARNPMPTIIFLDLIIPPGETKGFHLGELPESSYYVIISGIPLNLYKGPLPKGRLYELNKPISYEGFSKCVETILKELKLENCESTDTAWLFSFKDSKVFNNYSDGFKQMHFNQWAARHPS